VSITLIVGLGNPGAGYTETRHNAGFWLIERLATQHKAVFRPESKFHGEICQANSMWLLKPATFMNRSGQAVAAFIHFYKIMPTEILIVHDELDLPPGTARLKQGGGHGGHNGLKDIIAHLNTNNFLRLRVGIGRPAHSSEVTHYVLHTPTLSEQIAIDTALDTALTIIPSLQAGELNKAMQHLHQCH